MNTANVVLANLEISLISPGRAPWVLNNVVIFSETNNKNTMIEFMSTKNTVKNSTLVVLENIFVSFNCNRYWLFGNSSVKLLFTISFNILERFHNTMSLGFDILACSILSSCARSIWISRFIHKWVWLNPLESSIHWSTFASTVSLCVTRYKLLFRVRFKCPVLRHQEISTFDWAGSWESPTWTTLSLIFNFSDSSFGSPIDWGSIGSW